VEVLFAPGSFITCTVILEGEVSGYVGSLGMKTFISLSCSARQILLGFFLTLHKNYLVV